MENIENMPAQLAVSLTSMEQIIEAYKHEVLHSGHRPASVYAFMKKNHLDEAVFYDEFNSFEALEEQIWAGWLDKTIERLENDTTYQGYSAREKFLALFYTLFEMLKKERSFAVWSIGQAGGEMKFLKGFKSKYMLYANGILADGKAEGQIEVRPFISGQYPNVLWEQFKIILRFWIKDRSKAFEQTDAAIEKSANVIFDLLGRTFADSGIDFVKFLWQQRSSGK